MSRAQSLLFGVAVVFCRLEYFEQWTQRAVGSDCTADHNLPGHQYLQ